MTTDKPRTAAGRSFVLDHSWRFERGDLARKVRAIEAEALRDVIEEVEAEEKRWLEWWARGGKGPFVWKRDAVQAAKKRLANG